MKMTIAYSWIHPVNLTKGVVERVTQWLMDGGNNWFVYDEDAVGDIVAFLHLRSIDTVSISKGIQLDYHHSRRSQMVQQHSSSLLLNGHKYIRNE